MSVVIIGGNECMECQYKTICNDYKCKAKVFTKDSKGLDDRIGDPDLIVLFTNPVSHDMVKVAKKRAANNKIRLVQSHCGSANSLRNILIEQMNICSSC